MYRKLIFTIRNAISQKMHFKHVTHLVMLSFSFNKKKKTFLSLSILLVTKNPQIYSLKTAKSADERTSFLSFVSAEETIADLNDFEEFDIDVEKLELYQAALGIQKTNGVPYR